MKRSTGIGVLLALFLVLGVVTTALGVGRVEGRLADAADERLTAAGFGGVSVEMDGRDATLAGFSTPADAAAAQDLVADTKGMRNASLADGAIAGSVDSNEADDTDDGGNEDAIEDEAGEGGDEDGEGGDEDGEGGDEDGEGGDEDGDADGAEDESADDVADEDDTDEDDIANDDSADEEDGEGEDADAEPTDDLQGQLDALMDATRVDGEQFASLSTELSPAMRNTLEIAAELLNERPELRVEVAGHTDFHGSDVANQALSQGRAQAVARFLIDEGVAADRVDAVGYGESVPIGDNNFYDGQQQNRRVELNLIGEAQ